MSKHDNSALEEVNTELYTLPAEDNNEDQVASKVTKTTVSPFELVIPDENLAYETHPAATRLYRVFPILRHIPVFNRVTETFGPNFSISLGICYLLSKGLSSNVINVSRQPMFMRQYRIETVRFQRLSSTYSFGWSMKAFVAVFTDAFPLFGYSKRWYMAISALIGAAFALGYALLPAKKESANAAAAFIFLTCFAKANIDILSEGLFSRFMRLRPKAGPAVVSWVWATTFFGTTISAAMMGPLSDLGKTWIGILVSAILQLLVGIFFVFNLYGEQPNRVERHNDAVLQYLSLLKSEHEPTQKEQALQQGKQCQQECHEPHEPSSPDHLPTITYEENVMNAVDTQDFDFKENNNNSSIKKIITQECEQQQQPQHEEYESANALFALEDHVGSEEIPVQGTGVANIVGAAKEGHAAKQFNDVVYMQENQLTFYEPEVVSCASGVFEFNKEVIRTHWQLAILCVVIACGIIIMTCMTILGNKWQLLYTCVVIGPVICIGAFFALPPAVARAAVFTYLSSVLYLQFPGVMASYYMTPKQCDVDAPHFSYTFYITVSNVVADVASVIASILFTYLFSKHSYPSVFAITTLLEIIGSFFDLLIVRRWNLAIGIPDKVAYLLGDSVIDRICTVLSIMPQQILMSRLCPRGTESMMFAAMAGYNNAGISMSMSITSIIMETRWPVSSKAPCNYDNLQWLIIAGHFACPLLILPLAYCLLPWARVCDAIDIHGKVIAKKHQENEQRASHNNNNNDDDDDEDSNSRNHTDRSCNYECAKCEEEQHEAVQPNVTVNNGIHNNARMSVINKTST